MARVRVWVLASVVLVLLAAACGGDDGSSTGDDGEATSQDGGAESSGDDSSEGEAESSGDDSSEGEAESSGDDSTGDAAESSGDDSSEDGDSSGGAGGGNGGTLVLDSETIAFDSARCFLQEQDAAAGGGKILFVAQAFGTNAAGDQLVIDVSRFDEDSQFTGDDIIVDIGDPFSDEAVSLKANADLGTVTIDGSTLSAGDLTFVNSDDLSEQGGSFEINC